MQINGVKIYGLEETIVASGFPMLSNVPSNEEFWKTVDEVKESVIKQDFENKHIKRMFKLASAPNGSGHNNALKGIVVQFNLKAPRYFWNQLQRYNFVDFVSSMSQMHRIKSLNIDNPNITEEAISVAENLREKYEKGEIDIDTCLSNMPQGLEIMARLSTNYLQLKTIYSQRRTHRSKEWQVFCDWVEKLPFAKELITGEKN